MMRQAFMDGLAAGDERQVGNSRPTRRVHHRHRAFCVFRAAATDA
jgi:hypothetical protein